MTLEQSEFIENLAHQYTKHMMNLTYRRIGDIDTACDLVQETFLIACCKANCVCNHINPPGWLFFTLNNLILREITRQKREIPSDRVEDFFLEMDEIELPLEMYIPGTLSKIDREIILWRVKDGLSIKEISALRGISEAACRKQISRAFQRCRKELEKSLK